MGTKLSAVKVLRAGEGPLWPLEEQLLRDANTGGAVAPVA